MMAVGVETVVLHLWLRTGHPVLAWCLTLLSAATLIWLIADYRALGRPIVMVTEDVLHLTVGNRAIAGLPLSEVTAISQPSWRDIPEPQRAREIGYRNLMKPAEPNVLLQLVAPASIRGPAGVLIRVQLIGLRLDDPVAFRAAVEEKAPGITHPTREPSSS